MIVTTCSHRTERVEAQYQETMLWLVFKNVSLAHALVDSIYDTAKS